jgi:hypothetical protein
MNPLFQKCKCSFGETLFDQTALRLYDGVVRPELAKTLEFADARLPCACVPGLRSGREQIKQFRRDDKKNGNGHATQPAEPDFFRAIGRDEHRVNVPAFLVHSEGEFAHACFEAGRTPLKTKAVCQR